MSTEGARGAEPPVDLEQSADAEPPADVVSAVPEPRAVPEPPRAAKPARVQYVAPADADPNAAYEAKVLRAFLRGGRLVTIPARGKKREVILRFLVAQCFAEDRPYPEREVNERLAEYHEDVAALRRYMVIGGLLTRAGGEYRRVG